MKYLLGLVTSAGDTAADHRPGCQHGHHRQLRLFVANLKAARLLVRYFEGKVPVMN